MRTTRSDLDRIAGDFPAPVQDAIAGPANVGKSTLYNQLVSLRKDLTEVSPIPGTNGFVP